MNEVSGPLLSHETNVSAWQGSSPVAQIIMELKQAGVGQFDPVRLQFIETMARKAVQERPSVRAVVEKKIINAAASFQQDFSRQQEKSALLVATIKQQFPDYAEDSQRLFEQGNFNSVQQLTAKLHREKRSAAAGELIGLSAEINSGASAANNQCRESSFSDRLTQQENDSLTGKQADLFINNVNSESVAELDSVRVFRESLVKLNSDKLVTRVVNEGPESPGPLNPQALVIKSLATMRELSPDYLNRFVSYVDTLLWLEQASLKCAPTRRKKTTTKTRKKTPAGRLD